MNRLKNFAVQWLITVAVLMAFGYIYKTYFGGYSAADIEYAHTYAQETLEQLEQMAASGEVLCARSPQEAGEFYRSGESEFSELKYAAVHLKGRMAEDFVYAFALMEEWCRLSADSADRPGDSEIRQRADRFLNQARGELRLIRAKPYGSVTEESR